MKMFDASIACKTISNAQNIDPLTVKFVLKGEAEMAEMAVRGSRYSLQEFFLEPL